MKRYQVFVSSTYKDLVSERKEVIQALLELDCIPVGMELFPATDNDQWTLIKELIDESDYYILIVGGRYGSLNKEGISYTQMEYEYANKIGIPTISFLHKDPDSLPVSKTDKDSEKLELLENFKKIVSNKLIKTWNTPEELGSVVSRSLVKLIKTNPRIGWVKADKISSNEANLEILNLREKIIELENELTNFSGLNQENLAQGEDEVSLIYNYKEYSMGDNKQDKIKVTWNQLFSKTCTLLLDEASEEDYKIHVSSYIKHITKDDEKKNFQAILFDDFISILIQFKALGLIEKSEKKRSIKDTNTYWKLTNKGDALLTNLRAIRVESK
jgi:hypothetical protein